MVLWFKGSKRYSDKKKEAKGMGVENEMRKKSNKTRQWHGEDCGEKKGGEVGVVQSEIGTGGSGRRVKEEWGGKRGVGRERL